MVSLFEEQVLKIESLARYVDREDLPRPLAGQLVTKRIALEQHRTSIGPIPFSQDVGLGFETADLVWQLEDRLTIEVGKAMVQV
jgi:hypothetical protein